MSQLGSFLAGIVDESKKTKQADKVARSLYDFMTPEGGADGSMPSHPLGGKDQWDTLSSQDRIAKATTFVQAQALKQAMAQQKQQSEEQALKLDAMRRSFASEDALAAAMRETGQMNPAEAMQLGQEPIPLPAVEPTPDRLRQALARNPQAVNARNYLDLARAVEGGRGEQPVMPVPFSVNGRNLIVNPKSGAFQDVTPAPAPQIPNGMVPIGATEDEDGRLNIRYGFPKAEGKALTQEEVSRIAALNQAEMDLNSLEQAYESLGADYGGPVSGRVKSAVGLGQNPNIAALDNAIIGATPNLARGVFREVGVLTDADVKRYSKLLPSPNDTTEVRNRKITQLRQRISEGRKEMISSLESAGRNVEGFSGPNKPAVGQRFDSEQAAREAGGKAGDVIELYDPQTATYRKARLK